MNKRRFVLYLLPILALLCFLLYFRSHTSVPENPSDATPAADTASAEVVETVGADYQNTLFDDSVVHTIDITLSDDDWADLLTNPVDKTKYHADVVIDGEEVKDVSFATKGNSSLYFVASEPDATRFSFKVTFGKYVKGQTFHGLDKLNLNNGFCDATYMKEYFSYQLFRKMDVPAPLVSYIWVRVNGADHGLYLAVEEVGQSFLDRVYGGAGVIYKPETEGLGLTLDDIQDIRENGLSMTSTPHGADLAYTDDNPESYPDIFDNAATDYTDADAQEVIASLRALSEGKNLSEGLDTNEIVSYFAAQNFVLNYDSYIGAMLHNLILYENEGKLALLPWDYNLAFGAFIPITGDAFLFDGTDILNRGIDSPLIMTSEDERPMWKWIVSNDEYRNAYHDRLDTLVSSYFESGDFDREIDELYELLLQYVEKDPSAFYTADQYTEGYQALKQFCDLRAESIRRQLDGALPTVSENQPNDAKVDASNLNVLAMGAAAYA